MTTLHPSGCRCSGLDRVCESRRRAYSLVDEFAASPDPARRALGEAARSALMDGSREAEQSLRAVLQMAEGVTLAEALQSSAVLTLEEFQRQKAAVRERWTALVGSRS